jgi:hypothetical protein
MQDGIGQVGAGQDDRRMGGQDLQHATQLSNMLSRESLQHKQSQDHANYHVHKHNSRDHNSQHGHDNYKHSYGE